MEAMAISERKGEEDDAACHERNRKRREICTRDAVSYLDNLPDCFLMQVLLRLPTAKSAMACKVVSKRWNSLMSDPCFPSLFKRAHLNANDESSCQSTIISSFFDRLEHENHILVSPAKLNSPHGFTLTCLPEEPSRVCVVASSNDLVLCQAGCDRYYVCNPFTMQCVAIQCPDSICSSEPPFGILCEHVNDDSCRSRVVVCIGSKLLTYCPEISRWRQYDVRVSCKCSPDSNVVAFKGKLHWFNGEDKIVAFDPFGNGETDFIHCPQLKSAPPPEDVEDFHFRGTFSDYCLGVCQGFLQVMRLDRNLDDGYSYSLRIWKLEDYKQGEWILEHMVHYKKMVAGMSWVQELLQEGYLSTRALAFHPCREDIVYLKMRNHIFSYNKLTKEVIPVCEIPPNWRRFDCLSVFPLVLPPWPSPVSAFRAPAD